MKLYIFLDDESPEDVADTLMQSISTWLADSDQEAQPVDLREGGAEDWQLGITLETSRKAGMKKPLDFLYKQAKKMEREFVIGLYDRDTGNREDVCYFGYEEGRPDVDEVALYLGLKR